MLDHNILACELVRMRSKQIEAKYHYGIEDCSDCERLEEYLHALFLDELAACGTSVTCITVRGEKCAEPEIMAPCAEIIVNASSSIQAPPKIVLQ